MANMRIVTQMLFITFFDVISTGDFCMFQKREIDQNSNTMGSREM